MEITITVSNYDAAIIRRIRKQTWCGLGVKDKAEYERVIKLLESQSCRIVALCKDI